MKINLNPTLTGKDFSIVIEDMNSFEFDNMRVLLKTICDYGQFKNANELSKDLSADSIINKLIQLQSKS